MLGDDAAELDVDVTRATATESSCATSQPALALPSDNIDAGMPQTADEPPRRASDGEPMLSSSIIAATIGGASASTLNDESARNATPATEPCVRCNTNNGRHTCSKRRKASVCPEAIGRSSRRRTTSGTAATSEPALTMNVDPDGHPASASLQSTSGDAALAQPSTPMGARITAASADASLADAEMRDITSAGTDGHASGGGDGLRRLTDGGSNGDRENLRKQL